jgi:hypothetical protein
MATTTSNGKPTSRQLAYLKNLADRTGQTFIYPQTSRQASVEINRLKQTKPSSRTERYVERKLITDQIATGPIDAARVRDDEIHGRGSSATWMHNREQEPPPVEDPGPAKSRRRRAPVVGKRTELARYTVTQGERILYGQRIDGMVRFLPGQSVVLDAVSASSEDSGCGPPEPPEHVERPDAARQKRPNEDDCSPAATESRSGRRGRTGARVELARYVVSAGERQLFAQRIFGVVRVTDVPVAAGGRSYLVERELEQDGYGALKALVADYLRQAERLDEVPMACSLL